MVDPAAAAAPTVYSSKLWAPRDSTWWSEHKKSNAMAPCSYSSSFSGLPRQRETCKDAPPQTRPEIRSVSVPTWQPCQSFTTSFFTVLILILSIKLFSNLLFTQKKNWKLLCRGICERSRGMSSQSDRSIYIYIQPKWGTMCKHLPRLHYIGRSL